MRGLIILFLLAMYGSIFAQDTIIVTSKSDIRLELYEDSLLSYNIGHSVSMNLSKLYGNSIEIDYKGNLYSDNAYFNSGWDIHLRVGDTIDSNSMAEFVESQESPSSNEGKEFSTSNEFLKEYKRLDSIKIKPYGHLSAGEMPTIYLYAKPKVVVIYKIPCFSKQSKTSHIVNGQSLKEFSVLSLTTKFIVDSKGLTRIPYNEKVYYGYKHISKIEWVDPSDTDKVLKTINLTF